MPAAVTRRIALLLPALAAGCAGDEPRRLPPGPLRYGHLTPLRLNVAAIEVAGAEPPPWPADIGGQLPVRPAEAVRTMARDRLLAVGSAGRAGFAVTIATVLPDRDGIGCLVGCRLDVAMAEGARSGFVEAQGRARAEGRAASRPGAAELVLRRAMDELNVEFEYQLRRTLADWLVLSPVPGPGGGIPAPAPGDVLREDLPET